VSTVVTSKEYANKIAFTDDFTKRAKGKERDQYQQTNYARCDQLIESPAAELGKRV